METACFANPSSWDWSLTASCPTSRTQGELDALAEGWGFTADFSRNTRTTSWSIGAYEKD